MSIADDEFNKQVEPIIADGYVLNPPAFERIRYWTFVLFQLHFAISELEKLINDTPQVYDVNNSYNQHARFIAIIVTYARCFAQAGANIKSLNAKELFKGEPRFKTIHDRMIEIRNGVVAHTGHHELMRVSIAVKETDNEFMIKHFIHPIFPKAEFAGYLATMNHTVVGVEIAINKQLNHLEAQLGKPISVP
ncbi:hypothetical protein [Bradyrhizobium sp. AUGA SZCCT0042]|uniref:hypothetical protein n=1 Tax=Bradyrhizobium sp. AUGA SZCCT0042 TaxID=2807651 RepID=UPI001BAADE32|nr:hypothetical protein [Bradyrhizobium sp. AUGA SZCCT0042]MBR1296638.1 hypothetical protein [Bradyrhizobium sp. AUGA SZCCT0042]